MSLIYQDIEVEIRKVLIANAILQNLLNTNSTTVKTQIRVGHLNSIDNPTFPCITLKTTSGSMDDNQFSISTKLHVDIWGKANLMELQNIYSQVRNLINLKPITKISQIKEIMFNDDLYEIDTRTYHISGWFEIKAVNS